MRQERVRLSRHNDVAQAMDYMLKRWAAFARFLDDGRICLSNNAAERAVRGIALGRRACLFAGSDRGGEATNVLGSIIGLRSHPGAAVTPLELWIVLIIAIDHTL